MERMSLFIRTLPAVQMRYVSTVANSFRIHNLSAKKDHNYGNEWGHDIKDEVRKEKWIRKRNRRTKGENYRVSNGFEKEPALIGHLKAMNNWSNAETGTPGAPLLSQTIDRQRMSELAQDIFDAAMLVEKAKLLSINKSDEN